jgi:RimJ/RimL family protein N-acetyltransferase/predicted metal-dependent hydrolase
MNGKMKSRGRYQEGRLRFGAPGRGHIKRPYNEPVRTLIETRRLILRPFELDDVEAAFAWFCDPIVMRFTPSGPDTSIGQTKARLANYQEHQTDHGFSKWIVLDRHVGRPIGDSGLLVLQDYGWIDLGFRLAQPYWGQGLATEAAGAWVRAAFDDFHIDRLTAFVHPENVASIRVLKKLGFHAERCDTIMGTNSIVFSLRADDGETDSCLRRCMSLDWTQGDLHEGLRCFHSGAFFEAHEHWESVWLAAQEPEKTFLQGLIQVAAAFHHFQRSNYAGTISLLRSALRRLDAYPEAFAGVVVAPLRTAIRLWLGALETRSRSPLPPLPQLEISSTE